MSRLFLDASVLFAAAYRPRAGVRCLWTWEGVELATSSYVCTEVQRNLFHAGSRGLTEQDKRERLSRMIALVRAMTIIADPPDGPLPEGITLPEKDRPILLAAIAAGATYLLTADKTHFGAYFGRVFEGVHILPPDQFIKARSPRTED